MKQRSPDLEAYHYARSLGLCGRCKQRDPLPDMAYCEPCHLYIRTRRRQRQGFPRRFYSTKYTRAKAAVV